MILTVEVTKPMLGRIEAYTLRRGIEIGGVVSRAHEGDYCASLILCAGRKQINAEKRAKRGSNGRS